MARPVTTRTKNNQKKTPVDKTEKTEMKNKQKKASDETEDTEMAPVEENIREKISNETICRNIVFITVKITLRASNTFLADLRKKYINLLETMQEGDSTVKLLPVNTDKSDEWLSVPEELPTKMTSLNKWFSTSSRAPKSSVGTVWATSRISLEGNFEDLMNVTSYDLQDQQITLMKKRLQLHQTETPVYLQFINNEADLDDLKGQIQQDINATFEWTLYCKKPWEGYGKNTFSSRKVEMLAKTLHIECKKGHGDEIEMLLRKWIKSGKAALKFGKHIKVIQVVTHASSESPA